MPQSCNKCKIELDESKFKKKKDGSPLKRCIECNIKSNENRKPKSTEKIIDPYIDDYTIQEHPVNQDKSEEFTEEFTDEVTDEVTNDSITLGMEIFYEYVLKRLKEDQYID